MDIEDAIKIVNTWPEWKKHLVENSMNPTCPTRTYGKRIENRMNNKFKLINKTTNLTLGEHKSRFPLRIYSPFLGIIKEDDDFKNDQIKAIIRCDGAIGFQRLDPWYDEGEIYFLPRDEWDIIYE
jgi:hypothetical protein